MPATNLALTNVTGLSPADRMELIGKVWDTLSPEDLPVTDAERALLDGRLTDMDGNPEDQSPWPEVKARLERLDDQDEGISEALRRDAEIERGPNQAIPLAELDSQIQNRRKNSPAFQRRDRREPHQPRRVSDD